MLFSQLRRRRRPVVVDIGSTSVKLAIGSYERGSPNVLRPTTVPLPPGSLRNGWITDSTAVAEAIARFIRCERLQGAQAVTAVPGRAVMIKILELPMMDDRELDAAVEFEAMQVIPEKLSHVFLDYQLLGPSSSGDKLIVLLTAAKKDLVRSYMEALSRAGLVPAVVDVDYLALHNLCSHLHPDDNDPIVCVMHAGASVTTLSLTGRRGRLIFSSELETGGQVFTQALANTLGVSVEEAEVIKLREGPPDLVRRIRPLCEEFAVGLEAELKRLVAVTGSKGIDRLCACGGAIKLSVLRETLLEHFRNRVGRFEPLSGPTSTLGPRDELCPEFAVVSGLALRCS